MIHVSRISKIPDDLSLVRIRNIALEVFSSQKCTGDATIIFANNKTVQNLNHEYRNIKTATDVLSFPSEEVDPESGFRYFGDVIISVEKAQIQALQAGKPFLDELIMLIVHGCLHLTGLDHATIDEKQIMKSYQEEILQKLGVNNPAWPEED
jgi:probable rRNA maturation factor